MRKLPLLQIDFDGTLAKDGILIEGARQACLQLSKWYRLTVLTAREDPEPVWAALRHARMEHLFEDVSNVKQRGLLLDDHAVTFTDWPSALIALSRA